MYEKTREKLIGLTIPYTIEIDDSYDGIIDRYAIDNKAVFEKFKEKIIELFHREEHSNLRTLIASIIAIDDILKIINEITFSDKALIDQELETIILYTIYSSIRRRNGKKGFDWKNQRYGEICSDDCPNDEFRIYGYAFIDEYWNTYKLNKDIVKTDIQTQLNKKAARLEQMKKDTEHNSLALISLKNWYLLPDGEVTQLVQKMKDELSKKKYYPSEFKDIIHVLMCINNVNFGMNPTNESENNDHYYVSTEEKMFEGYTEEAPKSCDHFYKDWPEFKIEEYVDLMLLYFEDEKFEIDKEMIRVVSEDKFFAYKFRKYTLPILEKIDQREIQKITCNKHGKNIALMNWDEEIVEYCKDKKSEFMDYGRFLSLFELNVLIDRLKKATPKEIMSFCDAVKTVYSFSNLNECFSDDYGNVNDLYKYLKNDMDKELNEEKSRTKEIALRRLLSDMEKYERLLRM